MNDQFFGITDTGRQRKNNEDTFIAELTADKRFIIACVIDGVGGYSGGEIAAALARESILRRLDKPSGEIIPMIIDCFNLANENIIKEKQSSKEHDNMACVSTLAIVDLSRNQFYYAHVGDTRLYLVRDHSLVKISHDQSFVGFLEDSGRISETEAMKHPKRNEINKALGLERQLGKDNEYIETGQSPFLPGDMLLLCSDGLTDMLSSSEISGIVSGDSSLNDKGHKLIDAANHNGGKDNITVVLVQNDNARQQHDTAKPAANQKKSNVGTLKSGGGAPASAEKAGRVVTVIKTNKTAVAILTVLMLVFLAACIWEYLQNRHYKPSAPVQTATALPSKRARNKQEIKLQEAISHASGHVLVLSDTDYAGAVFISEAIQVNNDSLTIKARGRIVFQRDSGYNGAAFQLSKSCKSITLDSLTFVNFNVGISAYDNNALSLKDTRFINCRVSLLSAVSFADKRYISGKQPAATFKDDSVPVKPIPTKTNPPKKK